MENKNVLKEEIRTLKLKEFNKSKEIRGLRIELGKLRAEAKMFRRIAEDYGFDTVTLKKELR